MKIIFCIHNISFAKWTNFIKLHPNVNVFQTPEMYKWSSV